MNWTKIVCYSIFVIIFTACYYGLNKKLKNKWILIIYPLFFVASIYPIKLIYDHIKISDEAFAETVLKTSLMVVAIFCLMNFFYGIINFMVNTQKSFHGGNAMLAKGPVKWFLENTENITRGYHLFFYFGGIFMGYVLFFIADY